MKIQVVSYNGEIFESKHNCSYSTFGEPQSLDMFEINIFSLQNEQIWRNKEDSHQQLECTKDFRSIREMITASHKSISIISLPQNYTHRWLWSGNQYYRNSLLKDEINNLQNNLLRSIIPEDFYNSFDLMYENSITKLCRSSFEAAFCFVDYSEALSKSFGSDKATTIRFGNLILTTLNLSSPNSNFDDFINGIGLDSEKIDFPEWLSEYDFFDDAMQENLIEISTEEIDALNKKIEGAKIKLEENLKYKSILATNSDALVSVVLEILGKLLMYDFSDFIDEKKEDFLCKLSDVTFVGEIKGVTSNVKSEHVSQVDVHCQGYFDKLSEEGITENIKSLLIINPFRTKPIDEREDVHEIQIKLAERNGCLIITTLTLLKLFEKFLNDEISSERIVGLFKSKTGLLLEDDLKIIKSQNVDNSVYKI